MGTFGLSTPGYLSRGEFGAEVGVPRLLGLFDEYDVSTTWCIPSHTLRTFPTRCAEIAEHGHEIAAHGCYHEQVPKLDATEERRLLGHVQLGHLLVIAAVGGDLVPGARRFQPSGWGRCAVCATGCTTWCSRRTQSNKPSSHCKQTSAPNSPRDRYPGVLNPKVPIHRQWAGELAPIETASHGFPGGERERHYVASQPPSMYSA